MSFPALRICLLLLAATLLSPPTQASILSAIVKTASKVDTPNLSLGKLPDGNLQHLKLALPDGAHPTFLNAKLNADKEWVIRNSEGEIVNNVDQVENAALVVNKAHLPDDLNSLGALPANRPVLIHAGEDVFRLQRQPHLALKSGGAGIKITTNADLRMALAHFQRPWANGPVRILGLKDSAENSLSLRRGVEATTLRNNPAQLRGQTIAIAGKINGDRIKTSAGELSLQALRRNADQYDISLLIIDGHKSPRPKSLLKLLDSNMVDGVPQNTGRFLAQLHDPDAITNYHIAPSGKQQVLISRVERSSANTGSQTQVGDLILARTAIAAGRLSLLRPNEERAQELDNRLLPWLPSWVHAYLIASTVLGLVVINTTLKIADRIWPWQSKKQSLARKFETGLWLLFTFLLLLPLFGLPIALYRLVRIILSVCGWIINLLVGLMILLTLPFVKAWKRLRSPGAP